MDINNLVRNGSDIQVVLFIHAMIFKSSSLCTNSKCSKWVVQVGNIESKDPKENGSSFPLKVEILHKFINFINKKGFITDARVAGQSYSGSTICF